MTSSIDFLDKIPEWGVYLLTVLLSLLVAEIGFRLGLWQQSRFDWDRQPADTAMSTATLGLLAFLLAFVLSMAVSRFDTRRILILEEANAIGTTYLRTSFVPEPQRAESRLLLDEYTDIRVAATTQDAVTYAIARSEAIQAELWTAVELVADSSADDVNMGLYIDALNTMIDVHGKRKMAVLASRIPPTIIIGIYIITALNMALIGFNSSFDKRRNLLSLIALSLVFAVVIVLIIDLDRPTEGLLRVNQGPMLDLRRQLDAAVGR